MSKARGKVPSVHVATIIQRKSAAKDDGQNITDDKSTGDETIKNSTELIMEKNSCIKVQRISTKKKQQNNLRVKDEVQSDHDYGIQPIDQQLLSGQVVDLITSRITSTSKEKQIDDPCDQVYDTIAAVISNPIVERVNSYEGGVQAVADQFGASLMITANNASVIMGAQDVVDKVKQELHRLAKAVEIKKPINEPSNEPSNSVTTTAEDESVTSVPSDMHNEAPDNTKQQESQDTGPRKSKRRRTTETVPIKKAKKQNSDESQGDMIVEIPLRVAYDEAVVTVESMVHLGGIKTISQNLEKYQSELESSHTGELPGNDESDSAVCPVCGYVANNMTACKNHIRLHHKERRFTCNVCFMSFGFVSALRIHHDNHYDEGGGLKPSAIIAHLLNREGKEVKLSEADARQVEEYEEEIRKKKENPTLMLEKVSERSGAEPKNSEQTIMIRPVAEARSSDEESAKDKEVMNDEGDEGKMKRREEIKMDNTETSEKIYKLIKEKTALEFPCDLCESVLHSKVSLEKHKQSFHSLEAAEKGKRTMRRHLAKSGIVPDIKQLQCPHCDFKCTRMQNFTRHVNNHDKPDMYSCDECDYTNTRRAEVLRHKRNRHGEATLQCQYCKKFFRTQPMLNTHIAARHEKKYAEQCDHCGLVLSSKLALRKHISRHHSGDELTERTSITCNKCGRHFVRKIKFLEHVKKMHDESSNTDNTANENVMMQEDGKFQCMVCEQYKHNSARQVRKHIERMHCTKDKVCTECHRAFLSEQLLQKHIQVDHLLTEQAECKLCSKVFKSESKLRLHESRVHAGVRKYECEVCLRQFAEKHQMMRHVEIHLPEEDRKWRYECTICGKKYRFKCNYQYHLQDHTGQQPHACPQCNKSFKTKHSMEMHLSTHSEDRPHVCDHCDRGFKLKKYLDVHLLAHHTNDKFVCQACGRLFVSQVHLQRHLCRAVVTISNAPKTELVEQNQYEQDPNQYEPDQNQYHVIGEGAGREIVLNQESGMMGWTVEDGGEQGEMIHIKTEEGVISQEMLQQLVSTEGNVQIMQDEGGEQVIQMIIQGAQNPAEGVQTLTGVQVVQEEENTGFTVAADGMDGEEQFTVAAASHEGVESTGGVIIQEGVLGLEEGEQDEQVYLMCNICQGIFQTNEEVEKHMQLHEPVLE